MIKLTEVQSMHEQREMFNNSLILIDKGIWIEVINFNPHTEQVDITLRLEVEDVIRKENNGLKEYKIICRKLDIDKDYKTKEELAKKIINKHHDKLKASFAKCLIEGIDGRSIPELKGMLYKLGGGYDKQKNS